MERLSHLPKASYQISREMVRVSRQFPVNAVNVTYHGGNTGFCGSS